MEVDNKTDGETEYDVAEEGVEVPSEEMEGDGFDISEKTLRHTVTDQTHYFIDLEISSSKAVVLFVKSFDQNASGGCSQADAWLDELIEA